MGQLKLNNKADTMDMVCFSRTPIILSYLPDRPKTDKKASVTINASSMVYNDKSKDCSLTINGNTINGVDKLDRVHNRNFCANSDFNLEYRAISIINALRNLPNIALNYDLVNLGNGIVQVIAKEFGGAFDITTKYDNLMSDPVRDVIKGSSSDSLIGNTLTKVFVDVFYNNKADQRKLCGGATNPSYEYLATLEKNYFKDGIKFDITPTLHNVVKEGNTAIFKCNVYSVCDGNYRDLGVVTNNYIANGYLVNQGNTFIEIKDNLTPAMNVKRGTKRPQYNNSLLYTYKPEVVLSLYKKNGITQSTFTVQYLESDESITSTNSVTPTVISDSTNIITYSIPLNEDLLRDSHYVDIEATFGILRYNVINPPYSSVECRRVYWYNSYGGVSFFDFVGDITDERKSDLETYKKSSLSFYEDEKLEQEVVYSRENKMSVSLNTHLIEEDGLYQLYDLQSSSKAWVQINDVNYYIIIESITVNEPSDNVFTATIKYRYSLLDTFA